MSKNKIIESPYSSNCSIRNEIIKLKKYVFISSITILLGMGYISNIYKFSEKKIFLNTDVKIMSYNVRLFNHYKWSEDKKIAEKISTFITNKKPDILSIQEYYKSNNLKIDYPYSFIKTKSNNNKVNEIGKPTNIAKSITPTRIKPKIAGSINSAII